MTAMALLNSLPQSFAGIDYQPLQDLLAAGDWATADDLTRELILKIAGREDQGLRKFDIYCLPGADIKIIDRLWRAYSHERFGFTQQCKTWNYKRYDSEKMDYFLSQVYWSTYPNPINPKRNSLLGLKAETSRDLSAPAGCLPTTFSLVKGENTRRSSYSQRCSDVREQDTLTEKDFIKCFLNRLHSILKVPDGEDFPDILLDSRMNRRQLHEQIDPRSEAIALLDHLPNSTADIDYQPLVDALKEQNWQWANRLTRQLILGIANRHGTWLSPQDIKDLPIDDLEIMDRLWRAYSNCRFGFTIQRAIWRDSMKYARGYRSGMIREATAKEFGLRVGWKVSSECRREDDRNEDWVFDGLSIDDASAPVGHLPTTYDLGGGEIIRRKEYEPHPDDAVMGFLGVGYTMTIRENDNLFRYDLPCLLGYDLLSRFYDRLSEIQ
ncbi:MAG: hypothetical protein F6J87_19260 [Spirulina sp. SIO3F2]|nr:hypothetical protein [Spirulina sp. SIO3F2]